MTVSRSLSSRDMTRRVVGIIVGKAHLTKELFEVVVYRTGWQVLRIMASRISGFPGVMGNGSHAPSEVLGQAPWSCRFVALAWWCCQWLV
jgi:hypothetical protein